MRRTNLVLWLIACAVFVSCTATPAADYSHDAPGIVENDAGNALLVQATQAAQRAINERRTATIQAATIQAGATRDTQERASTATAEAIEVRQAEISANATQAALSLQEQTARQAATATADQLAFESSQTGTAVSIQATTTSSASTATRGAEEIIAAQSRDRATATAQAMTIQLQAAQADAERSQAWNEFFDSVLKIIVGIGSLALVTMGLIQLARYLDALATRQRLVETRSGTVLIVAGPNGRGYAAQLVTRAQPMLESGDEFDVSQVPTIDAQAQDLLKVTTSRGENWIAKTDPQAEMKEQRRKLAMRLLRESMTHYSAQGIDPRSATRVPGFRNLGWSADTWSRAIAILRPHLVIKEGRGGGAFCSPQYPNLLQLYSGVGERRIAFDVPSVPFPADDNAAHAA